MKFYALGLICIFIILVICLSSSRKKTEQFEENDQEDLPEWNNVNVNLQNVSVSGNIACGTKSDHSIHCGRMNAREWKNVPGRLKQLSVDSGRVCGVNGNNDIFCAGDAMNPQWNHIGGKLTQIDLSGNQMCGVGLNNDIYCADYNKDNWRNVPGRLRQLSISGRNMCGVNANDQLWCTNNTYQPEWKKVADGLKHIDLAGSKMCGINNANKIVCADYAQTNWTEKPGKNPKWMSVDARNNDVSYYTNGDGNVLFTDELQAMKYVEEPVEANDQTGNSMLPMSSIITEDQEKLVKSYQSKECKPVVNTLDSGAYSYGIISKNSLVRTGVDEQDTCYIRNMDSFVNGDCTKENTQLFDKRVIRDVYESVVYDPYKGNAPVKACMLKFKENVKKEDMDKYIRGLDTAAPKLVVMGQERQNLQDETEQLDTLRQFRKNELASYEQSLVHVKQALDKAILDSASSTRDLENIRRLKNEREALLKDREEKHKWGWV
jgi:hypothetical protein